MPLYFFPAYNQYEMFSVSWNPYLWIRDLFCFAFTFSKQDTKKETLSPALSVFYWQHEIVLLSQRLIRKKSLIRHQRKCKIITTESNILSFSNNKQCTLLQETNVPNRIDKSINKSWLFALAKKQIEKYSACGWSQTVLAIVRFTGKHTAFSGPLALSTNTLWKAIIESKPLVEELSILRQEQQ